MNWKLRFMNRATLSALLGMVLALVYTLLGVFGVAPSVTQDQVGDILAMLIEILAIVGVVVDPTTEGILDSKQAMEYTEPKPSA